MPIPVWLQAGSWGLVAGSALVLGAAIAYFTPLPHRVVASVMGFGGGVLIAVLAFELIEEAHVHGGFGAAVLGAAGGAIAFSTANLLLSRRGAGDRKRCGHCIAQPTEAQVPGSGLAIAVGALLDGTVEAIIIGLSLAIGPGVSVVAVVGFFVSNLPEGLSSASGMKMRRDRPPTSSGSGPESPRSPASRRGSATLSSAARRPRLSPPSAPSPPGACWPWWPRR